MFFFFFFNDTATTEIYTLSLHDALPISFVLDLHPQRIGVPLDGVLRRRIDPEERESAFGRHRSDVDDGPARSEEHTSELQSRQYLVCRLLLEKKKKK